MAALGYYDFLRHGETVGGPAFRGSLDDPLSPEGRAQMQSMFEAHGPWERIICSPLSRCRVPAVEWASESSLPLIEDHRWRELHFGQWEGHTAEQLMQLDPDGLSAFWNDPMAFTPLEAEPMEAFLSRVHTALGDLLSAPPEDRCLVVTHAGVIRAILLHVLDLPLSQLLTFDVPHAGLFRLEPNLESGSWQVKDMRQGRLLEGASL